MRTVDSILEAASKAVANQESWAPSVWVECSWSLTALLGDEHSKLYDLEQQVAQFVANEIAEGSNVSKAKVKVEATELYKQRQVQRAKITRVEEMVRIAKVMARMKDSELHQ